MRTVKMNIEETKEYKKLCEDYNVNPIKHYWCKRYKETGIVDCEKPNESLKCKTCENLYVESEYLPKFTPQKQLNIVKLIGLERGFKIVPNEERDYIIMKDFKIVPNEAMDYILMEDTYANDEFNKQGCGYSFEEALVNLLIELKDNLDHAKVKEILEGNYE